MGNNFLRNLIKRCTGIIDYSWKAGKDDWMPSSYHLSFSFPTTAQICNLWTKSKTMVHEQENYTPPKKPTTEKHLKKGFPKNAIQKYEFHVTWPYTTCTVHPCIMLLRILSLSISLPLSPSGCTKLKHHRVCVCVCMCEREREYLNIFDTTFENVCVNWLKGQCSLQRCQRWRSVLSRPQRVVPFTAST